MPGRARPFLIALAALLALAVASAAGAAGRDRRASPHETLRESAGDADLTITYGRPYVRGRAIFGGLVRWGRVWCPGADEATTLTTTRALRLGELTLAPGRYTLWMLPSPGAWQLIVNRQTGQWHTQYHPGQDLGRVTLDKRMLGKRVEQLTFAIDTNRAAGGYRLTMRWDTTEVSAPFTVVK